MIRRTRSSRLGVSLSLATLGICLACSNPTNPGDDDDDSAAASGSKSSDNPSSGSTDNPSGNADSGTVAESTAGSGPSVDSGSASGGSTSSPEGTGGSSEGQEDPSGGAVSTGTGGDTAEPDVVPSLVGDVALSTPSQTFRDQIQVGLTTSIAGAEIRYTIDGTLPIATSSLYGGTPLSLTATTQVRAQAFVSGAASGSVTTGIYIARTVDPTSDRPIMIVDGYGGGKPSDKEVYLDAAVMIFEPGAGVASMASLPTYALRAGYHVRGQSSASFPQVPYRIELWDNANEDLDCPVLGMPADSDWALIPPYYDRTLIRNPFVFALGRDMGMQAPRNEFAEVYINYESHAIGEADYQGLYWVTELIKNAKVRTNLKQLKEDDTTLPKISGGYIFKFDQAAAEEPTLECTGSDTISGGLFGGFGGPTGGTSTGTCWTDLEVVDPDPLNAQQEAWITQYIQEFHDSLHLTPIGDYAAYIDVPSFIDYLIISEVTRNVDAYTRSAFYFKDRDQKIMAGPLWDYNFALGGVGAQEAVPTSTSDGGWLYSGQRNVNNWYPKLTSDAAFMAQVRTRYTELRQTLLSLASIEERMVALATPITQSVVRDFAKWPVSDVILSESGFTGGPTEPTWEGQLQVMRDFLAERLAWIDANLP